MDLNELNQDTNETSSGITNVQTKLADGYEIIIHLASDEKVKGKLTY